ncbi:DUF2461 domain-containing protein [Adhaeribacter sp. BT258]|uniref:DUF2461 domain-containing protein n=1 Tax=Adhaeribacter terrigena TaxID=2793070 RepID=A0ABS1BZG6_9BACT|nr:DUF2461 domain-containing protein [Adhaeribacter terrigena]MBK0402443.1 DUF2461 domain-containing protein [Adhaeribacter terrigena]
MKKRLTQATLDFIKDLQQNNQRDWFQENKARYEAAKDDFLEFVQHLIEGASQFEPALQDQQAKDTMFRIYRDVRFSNDKRPYKDHLCAYMAEGGRKTINPGYYLHINPNNQSFLACGLWMPPAPELKAVRQEIDYNLEEFKNIIEAPDFKKKFGKIQGEKLKTNPKGYDAENPAIDLLRHKSWNASYQIPDELLLSDQLYDTLLGLMKTVKPMLDFLIRPLHDLAIAEKEK